VSGRLHRIYSGETNIDFLGKRRIWFAISAVFLLAALLLLPFRPATTSCSPPLPGFFQGLNCGIEFKGGVSMRADVPEEGPLGDLDDIALISEIREVAAGVGAEDARVQVTEEESERRVIVQTGELATPGAQDELVDAVQNATGAEDVDDVERISSTWGGEITGKAIRALIFFVILVFAFLSLRFEWKMAVAAVVALIHDLIITIGVYAAIGFVVTPSTVIALLTILGYSLYDTVVVFDKVEEDTDALAATGRMTYQGAANQAMNEVFMRSLNTSLATILPVGALLFVGAGLLGATTMKDLALALFIGLLMGAYSSIYIATPILAMLKEREPKFKTVRERIDRDTARAAARKVAEPETAPSSRAAATVATTPSPSRPATRAKAGSKKAKRRKRR
jgi:preprotein translocase subunit SecF